jgi:hypothetical protein
MEKQLTIFHSSDPELPRRGFGNQDAVLSFRLCPSRTPGLATSDLAPSRPLAYNQKLGSFEISI